MNTKQKIRDDLGDLLTNSYKPQQEASDDMKKKGYKCDNELNNMETKIFLMKKAASL